MKKIIFRVITLAVLILSIWTIPAMAAEIVASGNCGAQGGNLKWTLDSDGVLTINGSGAMPDYSNGWDSTIKPPWYEDRLAVKKLVLNEGITVIGKQAFINCSNLTGTLDIPHSVKSINEYAFAGCRSFTGSLVIPENVTYIGPNAFHNCMGFDGSLTILARITEIHEGTFDSCSGFTGKLTLPDSLTKIGKDAFRICSGMTGSLELPPKLTYIGPSAFYLCRSFTGELKIPDSVSVIQGGAFSDCYGLTSVVLPSRLTYLGGSAFSYCKGLAGDVIIPSGVKTIGGSAFSNCTNINIYFEGNAPSVDGKYQSFYKDVTLHYIPGTSGWTDSAAYDPAAGTWQGYTLKTWNGNKAPENSSNGTATSISKLILKEFSPTEQCCDRDATLTMTFNADVQAGNGRIRIIDWDSKMEQYSVPATSSTVTISGKQVTVKVPNGKLDYGTDYYVDIDKGAFVSGNVKFYGFSGNVDKDNLWLFTTNPINYEDDITLKWAKSGWLFWKKDDYSKPPIPAGTDEEYANAIVQWAKAAGIKNLTYEQALNVLDTPLYLPMKDANDKTVLVTDGETTVKDAMQDIVFLENLAEYVKNVDNDLANVDTAYSSVLWKQKLQEMVVYEDVISWSEQINRYLRMRGNNTTIYYSSAAALAYEGLLYCMEEVGGEVYSFSEPYIRAVLEKFVQEDSYSTLLMQTKYDDYRNAAKQLELAYDLEKTVYEANAGIGSGGKIKIVGDIMAYHFLQTDNEVLEILGTAWENISKVVGMSKWCVLTGCSIFYFPLVIELDNNLMQSVKEMVCTLYFIGDYYVQDKYPDIYNMVYDENGCIDPTKIQDAMLVGEKDKVLINWLTQIDLNRAAIKYNQEQLKKLRVDLGDYILLLQYAKSLDYDDVKQNFAKFVQAEVNKGETITGYVECPVTVKVYDSKTKELLATLSSEDGTLEGNPYGSLYLMGENNETKCFVLNAQEYDIEIIPYEEGTMDVTLIKDDGKGNLSSKYFEDVVLVEGDMFTFNTETDDVLTKNETEKILQTEYVPVKEVRLFGTTEIAVGEEGKLVAEVLPVIASDQTVKWTSSDKSVLTVDGNGVITAISEGKAVITATAADGVAAEKEVQVFIPAEAITCDATELQLVVGDTYTPTVTVSPVEVTHEIAWRSSMPTVAVVDDEGTIYAVGEGSAILTAEIDGVETQVNITVAESPVEITLYQADAFGMDLKVDLRNTSSLKSIGHNIYVALYQDSRMIKLYTINDKLDPKETISFYFDLSELEQGEEYDVAAFAVQENAFPVQVATKTTLLEW